MDKQYVMYYDFPGSDRKYINKDLPDFVWRFGELSMFIQMVKSHQKGLLISNIHMKNDTEMYTF